MPPPPIKAIPLAALLLLLAAEAASAACACRCVEGEMRAICANPVELAPVCPPAICPLTPPAIRPIGPPAIPPPGAQHCREAQVLDPTTGRYQWQTVCR